jgi:hypothetical protein
MRRIAQALAVTGALMGMGLTALPAAASQVSPNRGQGPARADRHSPTRASAAKVLVATSAPVELAPVSLGMISPRFSRPASIATRLGHLDPVEQQGRVIRRLTSGRMSQAPVGASSVATITLHRG